VNETRSIPRPGEAGTPPETPRGLPHRTSVWRLPPWTRAPWLGLMSPGAVVAILVTTAILACAVASAPLFLSSARSGALQSQLAPQCAEQSWPTTGAGYAFPPGDEAKPFDAIPDRFSQAWSELGFSSHRVLEVLASVGVAGNSQRGIPVVGADGQPATQPVSLFWRPGVTGHVHALSSSTGAGVWLPRTYAEAVHAREGDRIALAGSPVTVAGFYTDLFDTDYGAYWCNYTDLFLNLVSANTPPPALVLATDQATALRIADSARFLQVMQQVPVDSTTLSVTDAQRLLGQQARAQSLAWTGDPRSALTNSFLPQAVASADRIESGLRGPVVPVAVAGGLLALVLVASAGSFWADRRANEVRLLAARGVGPVPLAGKAALEFGLPALIGAILGWGASRVLITALGPANDLDPAATKAAIVVGAAAFVAGLTCAATVAGLRARGTAERPLGAPPQWPSKVPWELALVAAAVWCWALLHDRSGIVLDHNVAQVDGLLVAFPLLGIAGVAVLLARLLTAGLRAVRRWAGGRGAAVFLAVNRLAAARLATATVLVAVTLPVAVLGYTATLTASSQTTIDAKVGVEIGAARAITPTTFLTPTPRTAAVGPLVQRYDDASVTYGADAGQESDLQMLAVDPRTFAGTAYWKSGFADSSLEHLVAELSGPRVDGRLPVVAQGLPEGPAEVGLGTLRLPVQVVDTARVLPGRRTIAPMIIASASRLPADGKIRGADRTSELWSDGPRGPAMAALLASGGQVPQVFSESGVFNSANFLGITWTFGYLSALAVFVGVIGVGGLLLYLEARSRTRVSGYVMARRVGLGRAAHLRSLLVELTGVAVAGFLLGALLAAGAVAVAYRRLDVDLIRPPTPLLDVPWTAVGLTALVTVLVAALAAAYAQRAADRADPATVLREDA
jgi:putative ABC transport system permease protein